MASDSTAYQLLPGEWVQRHFVMFPDLFGPVAAGMPDNRLIMFATRRLAEPHVWPPRDRFAIREGYKYCIGYRRVPPNIPFVPSGGKIHFETKYSYVICDMLVDVSGPGTTPGVCDLR